MGVDISDFSPEEVLQRLGTGDWHITLPGDHPDLVVSVEWRQEVCTMVACWFVRWVIAGISVSITHDYDPPWDTSGVAFHEQSDSRMMLARYPTLDRWLDEEYTGNKEASYESGMGWFWETYDCAFLDVLYQELGELVQNQFSPPSGDPDDYAYWDRVFEDFCQVNIPLQYALRLEAGLMTTAEAWRRFEHRVRAQLAEEKRQKAERAARYEVMYRQARQLWEDHFSDIDGLRVEKPQYRQLKLGERLEDVLADTDPEIVEAIVEVGLPGDFSNSVDTSLREIALRVLTDNPIVWTLNLE